MDLKKQALTAGMVGLASLLPMKKTEAQVNVDGWIEASLGIPAENLRLYPRLSVGPVNAQSLMDINGYYQFSKNDFYSPKLEAKAGDFSVKPVATFFQDEFDGAKIMGGPNFSYSKGNFFGFLEASFDPKNLKGGATFYTYNGMSLPENWTIGIFTIGRGDIVPFYAEIEATGRKVINGVSPYFRATFQEGESPGYQFGFSMNPREMFKKE